MEFNLADLFESVAATVPEADALVAGDRRLTYRALDDRANRLANHLAAAGVGRDDFVGLHLSNGTEYIEAMLACFKLRAVPVNINWRYVSAELRYLYEDAGLVGLIVHRRFGEAAGGALDAIADARVVLDVDDGTDAPPIGEDYEAALASSSVEPFFGPRSADDLYCVYTGGTTGMPKGVLWRHEDIFFAAMGGGDPMQFGNVIAEPGEARRSGAQPGSCRAAGAAADARQCPVARLPHVLWWRQTGVVAGWNVRSRRHLAPGGGRGREHPGHRRRRHGAAPS